MRTAMVGLPPDSAAGTARRARHHQRQRAGPEALGQRFGARCKERRQRRRLGDAADVRDERMRRWPPFDGEDLGQRLRIARAPAEAVDGLGGEGDQFAAAQKPRGLGDGALVGDDDVAHGRSSRARRSRQTRNAGMPTTAADRQATSPRMAISPNERSAWLSATSSAA